MVGLATARHQAESSVAEFLRQSLREEKFFVGHAARPNHGDLVCLITRALGSDLCHRFAPCCGFMRAIFSACQWLSEAGIAIDIMEVETVRIRHPAGIDLVVLTWRNAMDFVAAGPDRNVRARAAVDVDALGFFQEPDTHLETEVVRGQRADRADVGGIERVIRIEQTTWMHGQSGVRAALGKAENRVAGDFIHKTNAAAAHDATLIVESDAWADIDVFGLLDFEVDKARRTASEADREFLESALARLVANGAVERVIDEQEFHHTFAAFFHQLALGANAHVFADGVGASNDRARHPADGFVALFVTSRLLSGCGARRHAHLHQTHAAIAGSRELWVIAIMRDLDLHRATGFDHPSSTRELVPDTVDLHVDHAFFGSKVFG